MYNIFILGSYSYVDPLHKIRTVDYVANKQGFHALSNINVPVLPVDTPEVAAAKNKHLLQYATLANANIQVQNEIVLPVDTLAVQRAKERHHYLFESIAAQHAQLAAKEKADQGIKGNV